VKETLPTNFGQSLMRENNVMISLASVTTHTVRCVLPADPTNFLGQPPAVAAANAGAIRRMYLEYYQLGDLENLITLRIDK
jgi:hypothetical protein